jgi:hypothetical protein
MQDARCIVPWDIRGWSVHCCGWPERWTGMAKEVRPDQASVYRGAYFRFWGTSASLMQTKKKDAVTTVEFVVLYYI